MSGRRSSSSDGRPAGIAGSSLRERRDLDRERGGRLAEEHRERVFELATPALESDRVGARVRRLGLRAREIELADVAQVEALLQEPYAFVPPGHGLAQDAQLVVGGTQREIGLRHVRLQRERHRAEGRDVRLVVAARRVDGIGHAPEEIHLVAHRRAARATRCTDRRRCREAGRARPPWAGRATARSRRLPAECGPPSQRRRASAPAPRARQPPADF